MSDSVGSVSVEVVPDARGWAEKLRAQIRDQSVTINADADTTDAETQLDEVARTRTAKIKTDTSQFSEGASKLDQFIGNLGLLPSLAITAGAALVPLAAAFAGIGAAIAGPLAIAGGGAGLFGIAAAVRVKQTEEQMKAIAKAQTAVNNATPGPAKVAALKAYHQTLAQLSPDQKKFSDAQGTLGAAFQRLANHVNVLGPLTGAMNLLAKILPALNPVMAAVTQTFGKLVDQIGRAAQGPGFKAFVDQFAGHVSRDLSQFAKIIGNLAVGFGGLFLALDSKKLSGGVIDGLVRLSKGFANLGQAAGRSKWLRDFIDYFHRVGPQVASTAGALARSFGHIVEALAPLGPPVLHIIQGIADAFNSIPIPVLTGIAAAAAGLVAFQKVGGLKATSFLANRLTGGHGVVGGLIGAVKPVPVFVTNEGFGGPAGGGLLGKGLGGLGAGETVAEGAGGLGIGTFGVAAGLLAAVAIAGYAQRNTTPYGPRGVTDPGIARGGPAAQRFFGVQPTTQRASGLPTGGRAGGTPLAFPEIVATSTRLDALKADLARASNAFDLTGHSGARNFALIGKGIRTVAGELSALRNPNLTVILNAENAVREMERLQAYRFRDKTLTINERERIVGPGGGIGHPLPSGGNGGGASGRTVHIHLDDHGRTVLTGRIHDEAQGVYDANQRFNDVRRSK